MSELLSGQQGAVVKRNDDPIFRLRGVTKVYRMGEVDVHALRGVDLKIEPG